MPSGSPSPSAQTINQSNLPEYARPYFERLMARTEGESNQPYVGYTGERIAGFTPAQQQGFGAVQDMAAAGTPGLDAASGIAGMASTQALGGAGYNANNINVGMFDSAAADRYMSPYMDGVIERQKSSAARDFAEGQAGRDDPAIRSGAFGGYREGIMRGVAERGLQDRFANIEATGRQAAFENAQGQFERDRAAGFTADATNESNAARAAGIRQQGLGLALSGAGTMANIAGTNQALGLQRAGALQDIGRQEQELGQRRLDTAYGDFTNQRDFSRQQLNFLSGILRGVPVSPSSEVSQYTNPNPLNSALGLGIAGLGAYRAFK